MTDSNRGVRRLIAGMSVLALSTGAAVTFGLNVPAQAASPTGVTVKSFQYMPAEIPVTRGASVQWTNQDQILHTVTSGTPGAPDGTFNGSMDGVGSTYSFEFKTAGSYAYYCSRHESMTGKVVVR